MIKSEKYLIAESIAALVILGLIVSIFFVDLDLGIFKIVSKNTLMSQYNLIKGLDKNLLDAKTKYDTSIRTIESSKSDFKKQKEQYDAISDETISVINEATTDEKYNIEYMWIKLGNYAKANNLTLSLVEPGGSAQASAASTGATSGTTTGTTTGTTSGTTTGTTTGEKSSGATSDKTSDKTSATTTGASTEVPSVTTAATSTASAGELTISVKGNYTDVSSFIFELENDVELRFKLDKLKMEYAGSNQITTSFAVKNLTFIK